MNTIDLSKQLLNAGEVVSQGEIDTVKVSSLPAGIKKASAENGNFILAHSETGHHHVVKESPNINYYTTNDPLISYLEVIETTDKAEAFLEHLRSFDTHQPIGFDVGIYKITTLVELGEDNLWQKVCD